MIPQGVGALTDLGGGRKSKKQGKSCRGIAEDEYAKKETLSRCQTGRVKKVEDEKNI